MPNALTEQKLALEQHFDAPKLASLWGVSCRTIHRLFRNEPGVLRIQGRARETLRIPAPVAERVHRRMEGLE